MDMRRQLPRLALALLLIVGIYWFMARTDSPGGATQRAEVELSGAGSTFSAKILERWISDYQERNPDVTVRYDAVGSGKGITRFIGTDKDLSSDDLVDFAVSDSAMTDEQISQVRRGVQMVPITAGTVVLAYNLPGLGGDLKLSRTVLAGIFLGSITKWNDPEIVKLNPGANVHNLTITLVVRNDSSGTTFAFTNHLSATSDEWRERFGVVSDVTWPGTAMRVNGNEGVAARIKTTLGSIGYVHYGLAERLELRKAQLENKAGNFIKPTALSGSATLASAEPSPDLRLFFADPDGKDSYPIVTLSWALLYKDYGDARKAQAVRDLFNWCLTEGQSSSSELGYLSLTSNIDKPAIAAVEEIGVSKSR